MSQLETDLSPEPYYDDYDPLKRFYRVLFVPSRAVQVRELNQQQTIFQEQIRRFGDHVFKDGSVVAGCNMHYIPELNYVRMENGWNAATANVAFDENIQEFLAVSANTGTRASVRLVKQGYKNLYPDTNVLYVDYIKNGRDGANNQVRTFSSGETINFYDTTQDKFNNTLDSGKLYNSMNVLTANVAANQVSIGKTYGVTVGEGIVYQKGFFVNVLPHTITVLPFSTAVDDYLVGFNTAESIITHLQDQSLNDPASTGSNNAPGADRLRLIPTLVSKRRADILPGDDFFPIVEFSNGKPVIQNTDPEYAKLGDYLAVHLNDHAGDFYVKPLITSSEAYAANTAQFNYVVSPGVGYVKGNRVELISARRMNVDRAIETDESQASIVTLNYGYYSMVNEVVGMFDHDQLAVVDIYDTAQKSITDLEGSSTAPSGTKVGTANIRSVIYDNGTKGVANCVYRAYVTNIIMNTGKSFATDAKSLYSNTAYGKAKADFILESSRAVLKDSGRPSLIFPFGLAGLKRLRDSGGSNDTQFYVRDIASATMQSNGTAVFTLNSPHAGGVERFFSSVGALSSGNELKVDVVFSTSVYTNAQTGTVNSTTTGNTLTGSSTLFTTQYKVGESIRVSANTTNHFVRMVMAIANNTSMTLNAPIAVANTTAAHRKYWEGGTHLDLSSNVDVNVISNTQFSVTLGSTTFESGAPQTVYASFPILRSQAVAATKTPKKNRLVKIDCSTAGIVGPWNLGFTDVYAINAAYVGTTYSTSNPNRFGTWFTWSDGQAATHYDHGKLYLNPVAKSFINSSTKILVDVSYFEHSDTSGIGFYSVDSYPVRLPGVSANSTNISFADIRSYGGMDLRNCVDFRPSKFNTANDTTVAASATINPAVSNTSFNVSASGTYIGEPDTNFQADIEYYMPRIDLIQINKDGSINVKSSPSSLTPKTPIADQEAMPIGSAYIPPFPSLATGEPNPTGKEKIAIKMIGNRGYTMKDINTLDQRISRLEYYQTLSLLESQAKDYTVKDENGLDRFKNGIFADPFNNHLLGDYSNFEYAISIDPQKQIARPKIDMNPVDLKIYTQSYTQVTGQILSLPYQPQKYITQQYASKFRNCTESVWAWNGQLSLFPSYDHYKDTTSEPDVNVTVDLATPWQKFANSPFGMNFGDWRTLPDGIDPPLSSPLSSPSSVNVGGGGSVTSTTITTTTNTILQRDVNKLNVKTSVMTQDLGSYLTDVTLNPFMRSREVAFIARGLRPNARFWVFFDKTNVTSSCAPGTLTSSYNAATGTVNVISGNENAVVARSAAFGTQLISSAGGDLYGVFRLPDSTFRVGDREMLICDVEDLTTGDDAILSSCRATYTASSLSTSSRGTNLTTISPVISTTTTKEVKIDTKITQKEIITIVPPPIIEIITIPPPETPPPVIPPPPVTPPVIPPPQNGGHGGGHNNDPLGQSFLISTPDGVPGLFLQKIGVYFKKKDPTLGITCNICEVTAGVPDATKFVASAYLKPSEITVSANSSTETVFNFPNIPYLTAGKYYVFYLQPDGDSPEYQVFMAEIGATDLLTGQKIFSNPNIGVAFVSSNSSSWTPLQTEDLKFNIYRALFSAASGSVVFSDQDDEYLTTNGMTLANSSMLVQTGDVVYSQNSSGGLLTSNSSPFAIVQKVDYATDTLILDSSRGGLTANTVLQIHRPAQTGNTSALSANTLIANTTIQSIDNYDYSLVVPRLGFVTPFGTTVDVNHYGLDTSNVQDQAPTSVQPEVEREYVDKMRTIRSKSNRSGFAYSSLFNVTLKTTSNYISPIIDLRRRSALFIKNIINNVTTNEDTRYGDALTKYISQSITLAEGQDAEDIRVFCSGYRPVGTNITCYVKFLNSEDSDNFEDKVWTQLNLTGGETTYSSSIDTTDFREYEYTMPTAEGVAGSAYCNPLNNNILQYKNAANSVFVGYKRFAIKLVLTSDRKERVPRMDDVRSIALQI